MATASSAEERPTPTSWRPLCQAETTDDDYSETHKRYRDIGLRFGHHVNCADRLPNA